MSRTRAAGNFCPPRRALVTECGSSRVRNNNPRQSYTEPLLMRPSAPLICWAEAGPRPCRDPAATPLTSPGRFQEATGVRDFYGCRRMNKNLRQSYTEPLLMRPSAAPLICWAEAGRRPCRDPAATPPTSPGGVQEETGMATSGFPRAKSGPFLSPQLCARQAAAWVRHRPRV